MFVSNDIPSKYLRSFSSSLGLQQIKLKQRKLLFVNMSTFDYFLSYITGLLDQYLNSYEDFVTMEGFNANESNPSMENF